VTDIDERLSALLHSAAPEPPASVAPATVMDRGRRRRAKRRISAFAAATTVLLGLGLGLGLSLSGGGNGAQRITPAQPPPARPQQIAFQGVTFALPSSWHFTRPVCGLPQNHTLAIGTWTSLCSYVPPPKVPPVAVRLVGLYGPRSAGGTGNNAAPIDWHGQPAWITTGTDQNSRTATLDLPWLNVMVVAYAPDAATARALLDRVEVHPQRDLALPPDATSVFVQSFAGHDGDGQNRSITLTRRADVHTLLADLRVLPLITDPAKACATPFSPDTVALTVHGTDGTERTYLARFGDCDQLTGGTGVAAATTATLRADIRRLLPNSGLAP